MNNGEVYDFIPEKANISEFKGQVVIIYDFDFDNGGLGFVKLKTDKGEITTASRIIAKQLDRLMELKRLPCRALIREIVTTSGVYYCLDSPKAQRSDAGQSSGQ